MAKKADIGSKRLVSLAPAEWVQWITGQSHVVVHDIIEADFQWIGRESDVLIRASSPTEGDFLALTEMQLRYTAQMPRRVRAYAGLAEEKYGLPVYPVLINILPPPPSVTIATCYNSLFMGLQARQDYRVINLWEVDVDIVFQQSLLALLPFVPVLRGGGNVLLIQRALYTLRADERLSELEPLLAFFASFALRLPIIQQMMRWDMIVVEESPWYQEILQRGVEKGLLLGREEGFLQGLQEALERERLILERILRSRFGNLSPDLSLRLRSLTADQIESLVDVAVLSESLESFLTHLPVQQSA